MGITNINYVELQRCVVDELHIRKSTNSVNLTSSKDTWQTDTYLLAKFINNLEAGIVKNEGFEIVKFAIKRRKVGETTNTLLGYVDYIEDGIFTYIDTTQSNNEFIYSIVPVSDQLSGTGSEIQIKSDFTGFWIVDKTDLTQVIRCDQYIGSEPDVQTQRNEGRTVIETFNQYPQIYKTPKKYHSFTLTAALIPQENQTSWDLYQKILEMSDSNKPFIVKSGAGDLYVAEISNPRKISPMNAWRGRDYIIVNIDCVEVMSEQDYQSTY